MEGFKVERWFILLWSVENVIVSWSQQYFCGIVSSSDIIIGVGIIEAFENDHTIQGSDKENKP